MQEPTIYDLNEQPVVLIKWYDIIGQGGWPEVEEVHEAAPQLMLTYGKIVVETSTYITMCGTWSEECEETYGDVNTIPRGCIKSVTIISGK